ncbi:MAG: hypothetical protein C0456_13810 [Hyphomonas sp.]|uniref:VapE domain-containing protein n=1 Tax=Hyphomonas sp. TaxID=87 RepID=UPI001DF034A2|nr:VapE domain-containing protein [Hyphomonas sp.]MBA4227699.1 hypothetical protein [Hyphomonas sp.]
MSEPAFQGDLYTDDFDLIPLHRWDATRTDKGKTRKVGKSPIDKDWVTRPFDRAVVAEMVARGHNYGVRLKPCHLVVDVDPRNMPEGRDTFAELCDAVGLDPDQYPCVRTGSGGLHVYMCKPESVAAVNELPEFPGVEFKSYGRQVVAAGSLHPDTGQTYEWASIDDLSSPPPAAPQALLELVARPTSALTSKRPAAAVIDADRLQEMLDAMDPCDYGTNAEWEPLLMSVHDATGGDEECGRIFDAWCSAGPGYRGDVMSRWRSLRSDREHRRGVGTLMRLVDGNADALAVVARAVRGDPADDFAADIPSAGPVHRMKINAHGKAADTIENAFAAVAESGLRPRLNEFKRSVVFERPAWDASFGTEVTEDTLRLVRELLIVQFGHLAYSPSRENVSEAVMTIAYKDKFNPVTDYLDGLTWDGVRRIDGLFPAYFRTTDGAYERAVGQAFMVGAVARARRPGCKRDEMPVLKGRQGAGKSTGLRVLFSDAFFSDAELNDLRNKDAAIGLEGTWLHEFAELDGLSRSESSTLKAFLSRAVDRYRPHYGKVTQDVPRRSVFAGTCNEGSFLQDGTGARRYWPLTVTGEVDVEAISRDRDQLWAEADAAFKAGEAWSLPPELWGEAAERQADETAADPWADEILAFLEHRQDVLEGEEAPSPHRVLTRELLGHLVVNVSQRNRNHERRLRSVMESLGWEHSKSVRVRIDGADVIKAGYKKVGT